MAKKNWGTSDKVQEARERKAAGKQGAREAEAKAKDDAYWDAHANPRTKRDAKREAADRSREEAAARKAEARRLAAEEAAALGGGRSKPAPKPKLTHHQLMAQREREQRAQRVRAEEASEAGRREVSEDAYAATVEVENRNVEDADAINARGLDQALQQMAISEKKDMHPERRAKAAWESYFETELARMKEEKPGLRLMQYKSMIFENWQRSPFNPRNQPPDAK